MAPDNRDPRIPSDRRPAAGETEGRQVAENVAANAERMLRQQSAQQTKKPEASVKKAAKPLKPKKPKRPKKEKKPFRLRDWLDWTTGKIDAPFVLLIAILQIVGLVMLYSASYTSAYYKFDNPYEFIVQQSIYAVLGFAVMILVSGVPYQRLHKLWMPLMGLSLVLLGLVLLIGTDNNTEAVRWIKLGPLPSFQPSEIAKAAVVLCFASLAVHSRNYMKDFRTLLPFFGIMAAICLLLLLEPHLSATIIVCATAFIVLFAAGAKIWHLLAVGGAGVAGVLYLVLVQGYQMDRIRVWQNPWSDALGDGYQIIQSLYAVCTGGFWGLGLGQSRQKQMYLPESYNDFIFAIISEELGFVGACIVILLFAALVVRGFLIAMRSRDTFGTLVTVGFISQIAIQVFFNIGVVTGLLPVTGASLPFFSSGASSLLVLYAEMGVILSVSRQMNGARH